MAESFTQLKRKNLEKQLAQLFEEYEAVFNQLSVELSASNRVILERRIKDYEHKIEELEQQLRSLPNKANDDATSSTSETQSSLYPLQLDIHQRRHLITALLNCSSIQDRATRDLIVNDLPSEIRGSIKRHDAERVDVTNIVKTCINYSGGLEELIEIVRVYEGGALSMNNLDLLIASFS